MKDFKYTIKTEVGKILVQAVVTFGSKAEPIPENWEEDVNTQIALKENYTLEISDNLKFDI